MELRSPFTVMADMRRSEREYKKAIKEQQLISNYQLPLVIPTQYSVLPRYQKTNIVLLPGFNSSHHEWDTFENGLLPWGRSVMQAGIDVKQGNMDLTDDLYRWLADHDLLKTPLSLIGFSNGGLIGRALLRKYKPANVKRIIMIGTPNWGTSLAIYGRWFMKHPGIKDLTVGSDFLNWLNQDNADAKSTEHFVIVGDAAQDTDGDHHDGVVWENSATLGYTLPYVRVETGEPIRKFSLNSAWHLNLTRKSWRRFGPSNDKAWPITLNYVRYFLTQ